MKLKEKLTKYKIQTYNIFLNERHIWIIIMKVIHHWASNHLSLISKAITAWPIRSSWPPPPYQAFLAMCSEMSLFWLTCCPYRLQDYLFSVIILLLPYMQSNWSFVFLTSLNRDTFTNCQWFFVTVTKDLCSNH